MARPRKLWRALGAMSALLAVPACGMFHENVKGGFACAAPKGVCAPSTTIDNDALSQIKAGEGSHGGQSQTGEDAAVLRPVGDARPALKVMVPAWRDGMGRIHDRVTLYAPVRVRAWKPADAAHEGVMMAMAERHEGLLGIAERAPEAGLPDAGAAPVGGPRLSAAPVSAPEIASQNAGSPGAPAVLDAIRDKVRTILTRAGPAPLTAQQPANVAAQPASPSATPSQSAPLAAASFPPKE